MTARAGHAQVLTTLRGLWERAQTQRRGQARLAATACRLAPGKPAAMKAAPEEIQRRGAPNLQWAGKAGVAGERQDPDAGNQGRGLAAQRGQARG